MADSELLRKLQRRQTLNEEEVFDVEVHTRKSSMPLGTHRPTIVTVDGAPPSSVKPVALLQVSPNSKENGGEGENELTQRLNRRQQINDGVSPVGNGARRRKIGIYAEFTEFSRKKIQSLQATFKRFDVEGKGHMNLTDLKRLMESLHAPQTHLALKALLREVDEDGDNLINEREFLLIFRKAAEGQLGELDSSALAELASLGSIDVKEEGVLGARDFFEAKIVMATGGSAFEREVREEQEAKKREEEAADERRRKFRENMASFQKDD